MRDMHAVVAAVAAVVLVARPVGCSSPLSEWGESVQARIHPGVALHAGDDLRATASQAIKAGEELVALPGSAVFSKYLEADDPAVEFLLQRSGAESVDDRVHLVLSLLREARNRVSAWGGWLNALPKRLQTPLFFDEGEMALLEHHDAHGRVQSYRRTVTDTWSTLLKHVVESGVSMEQFQLAFALVSGRRTILELSEERRMFALLPLINCARHSSAPNARIAVKMHPAGEGGAEGGAEDVFAEGAAEFVLLATQNIPAGAELTFNYGFADNFESFLAQGVVQDDPALDSLTFVVAEPEEDLRAALTAVGLERYEFRLTPTSIPVALLQYLRVKNGANSGDEAVAAVLKEGRPASMENDRLALAELMLTVRALQAEWKTTAAQDQEALAVQEGLSPGSRVAVAYRVREKLLLDGVDTLVKQVWSMWLLNVG